jgi:hypothetical protein
MGVITRRASKDDGFPASDVAIFWLKNVAGFVAIVTSTYGGFAEMATAPGWDACHQRHYVAADVAIFGIAFAPEGRRARHS